MIWLGLITRLVRTAAADDIAVQVAPCLASSKRAMLQDAVPKEVVKKTGPFLIPIADPLADEKMTKKVLKLAKKASKRKQTKRGTKEVVKGIRKGLKGCAASEHHLFLLGFKGGCTTSVVTLKGLICRPQRCRHADATYHSYGASVRDSPAHADAGSAYWLETYLQSMSSPTFLCCAKRTRSHTSMSHPRR